MASGAGTHLRERYAVYGEIASGGMATVHLARLLGPVGFARTVAIKRLHAQFAKDPEFLSMFLDEARLAARISHPNVVQTLDVVAEGGEVFLVMDYVQGETLSRIMRDLRERGVGVPLPIANSIATAALQGLHAAHEATTERGKKLEIVHRDVSPQNIIVGVDGVTRVLDFGVAKASWRAQTTRDGHIKGKLSYMAPEQLANQDIDRRVDIYALGVVLWEALTGRRLILGDNPGLLTTKILEANHDPPSKYTPDLPPAIDEIVMQALAKHKEDRFDTARSMCVALEKASPSATAREVGEWLEWVAGAALRTRAASVAEIESETSSSNSKPPPATPDGAESAPLLFAAAAGQRRGSNPEIREQVGSVTSAAVTSTTVLGTSPSTVAPMGVPKPFDAKRAIIIALGLLGVLFIAGIVIGVRGRRTDPTPSASAPPATESRPAAATAVAAATSEPVVVPSAPAASAAPSAVASVTASATASVARAPAKPPTRTQSKPAGCDPPYTIDAKGIKLPKPQCF